MFQGINLRHIARDALESGKRPSELRKRIRKSKTGKVKLEGHCLSLAVAQRVADFMRSER